MSNREEIVAQLARIKNVGPVRALKMHDELGVTSVEELAAAAANGELCSLSGIGEKTEASILEAASQFLEGGEEVVLESAGSGAADESGAPVGRVGSVYVCSNCGNETFDERDGALVCSACRREYKRRGAVLDLAPPYHQGASVLQRVMEHAMCSKYYEEFMRPGLMRSVPPRSLQEEYVLAADLLELTGSSRVLDVACGTGNFTRYFAHRVRAQKRTSDALIMGVDLSWSMLEEAARLAERDHIADDIIFVRGDAARLPMQRGAFDRVHCAGALHLFRDVDEVLRNFARVLKLGGLCVIGTFVRGKGLVRRVLKGVVGRALQVHWFDRGELIERLRHAGFEVLDDSRSGDAWTIRARRV
ncbi:MAG: methyltransferase domain-containing protein [Myxococcota bacterium]